MSNVLVFVEHADGQPKKAALASITFARQVAAKSGGSVQLLVVGHNVGDVATAAARFGAAKVYVADHACFENYLAESYVEAIVAAAKTCNATTIAAATSSTGKDLLPRAAGRLAAAMASDVVAVVDKNTFKRPMWAGNAVATVELTTAIRVCTVRSTEFTPPEAAAAASAIEALPVSVDLGSLKSRFVSRIEVKSGRPDVTTAARVVAGGRGVKSAEGFHVIEQLADALGAGVGASRAVCDAGWAPNDLQIGQTGKVVAPDLYFAIGISGAIQHVAGMKGSKVVVAINKDPEAPIFQVADYGLVADLFEAVPELLRAIR